MARKVPKAFLEAVATHRHVLNKVISAQATKKMKALYDEAQGALVRKLRSTAGRGMSNSFTAHQQRMVLVQLRQGQALITQRMAKDMGPLSKQAQEKSLNGLVEDVSRLNKAFTGSELTIPVEEAATFAGVIKGRTPSLLQRNKVSMARYGVSVVEKVEKTLALTLLKGESTGEAIDKVADAIDGEWWQGERIVRTEMAYAYNATHADGVEEAAKEIPELMMQWQEFCDDDGEPMDDRVAVDSIAMHGQVASPGSEFFMPATAPFPDADGETKVPFKLVGLGWEFPPNRPNDRAVLSPWMEDWGVPGWRYAGGRRIQL